MAGEAFGLTTGAENSGGPSRRTLVIFRRKLETSSTRPIRAGNGVEDVLMYSLGMKVDICSSRQSGKGKTEFARVNWRGWNRRLLPESRLRHSLFLSGEQPTKAEK